MLVGTATTGAEVMPATRLARAPSMPATTTTASASARSSTEANSRWTPATPTSVSRTASMPWAARVVAHSSATGRSAEAAQPLDGVVGGDGADLDGVEQPAQGVLVHVTSMLPRGCGDEWSVSTEPGA